ncbi:YbaB/EbfC family nucleoid-associated protein [Desulfuribacillus alkaliarsenatis]|uniref:Nucleoid-associated protein BHF68_11545 n=1 Tax=Desulfuribacillus alkaliarsenatis TaxID=766136 RepID=A0A1E5FZQ8_9FIRM|nr:YbaB/EbfC family nucleoid-associated protein [Desulfuribacillus alkaliarsenatis]OEF95726.1 YbaB/EbfC family nucleoid-associated protein [Desulfuribacillus alkaliarsenatis]
MNMNQMMKQAKKLQKEMAKAQEELATKTVEGTAGGGVVTCVVNGHKQVVDVTIKPEAVDPDDIEMLEDLVLAAMNEALKNADELASKDMGKFTKGLNMPGLF